MKGNPAWPGIVISDSEAKAKGIPGSSAVPVVFLGAAVSAKDGRAHMEWGRFTPKKDMWRFAEGLSLGFHMFLTSNGRKNLSLSRAFSEALSYLKAR